MDVKLISIAAAAFAVSIGSIGPALAEGRSVAAAMDAIARQPEAAGTISRTLFVGLAMIETMAIYALVIALLQFCLSQGEDTVAYGRDAFV